MDGKQVAGAFQKGQNIGQYQVIGTLNRGKLAETYIGRHTSHNALVQIEVLRPPLIAELREDFLAQAQTLRKLEHPHILKLRDADVENHYAFLITDYISSVSLRQVYPSGTIVPLAKFLPYLKRVAAALQYAHDQKIVHGDVRPENILLDRDNHILLWGFTIEAIKQNRKRVRFAEGETMKEAIAYSAPEQIQKRATAASDQYSLAIIVYEFLSGELPFTGSYLEIADKQVHTPPPALRQKAQGISTKIEETVMKALEKDPRQRFPDVWTFINTLQQALDARRPASGGQRVPPPPPVMPRQIVPPAPAQVAPPPQVAATQVPPAVPAQAPLILAAQNPPPATPVPVFKDSTLAPRRGEGSTMTRRAFAAGLVGLAALGGAGGWYILSKRLAQPAPPTVKPDDVPPATPTVVNNKGALIFTGHLASVNAVDWSPDGRLIASASDDRFVQIFDAQSGQRKLIYSGHTEEVAAVAWSPNGRLIASGSQDTTAQVWNAANCTKVFTYKGHRDRVNGVSWSSDSAMLASVSEDRTVQVWQAGNGALAFDFRGHTAGVLCIGWQPDDSSVASGSWDGTLRDWATVQHGDHFNAGDQIFNYGGHGKNEVYALSWSPKGSFVASAGADQTVQISNGVNGTGIPPFFTGHKSNTHVNPVRAVAWSPDGNFIASGDTDGIVLVWQVVGRKVIFTYRGHKGAINALAWSPDGKRIASASADSTVHVWQPR